MTQSISVLSKRTKQDILDEYEKLQEQLEDLRTVSQTVHSQPAMELIEKVKTKTPQTIDTSFSEFQASLQTHLLDMRASLLEQTATLQDVQKAIELSRQQLELQRHITIAADTLDLLVEDQTKRSLAFTMEAEKRKQDLDEQISTRKKIWEREAEEYLYQQKLKQERDQVETAEREKILSTREAAIRAQEQEFVQMKQKIEGYPKELELALEQREKDVVDRVSQQFTHERALLEKETSAQIRLLELTAKNLQDRLTAQDQQFDSLKQQAQEANEKAQALAIKAIERPTTIVTPANSPSTNQAFSHDRGQGRTN
ncbi:hypothetical protein EPN81_00100 [Patescibacteria group bacterium]|nr:MAG: hypothetical protein EPN81_00100 [Patescibacteria group bacterium]